MRRPPVRRHARAVTPHAGRVTVPLLVTAAMVGALGLAGGLYSTGRSASSSEAAATSEVAPPRPPSTLESPPQAVPPTAPAASGTAAGGGPVPQAPTDAPAPVPPTTVPPAPATLEVTAGDQAGREAETSAPRVSATGAGAARPAGKPLSPPPAAGTPVSPGPGWRQVVLDDFSRSSLGSQWRPYGSKPDRHTVWDPGHVFIRDGALVIRADQTQGLWTTGGVAHLVERTYGKWEMRFRVDRNDDVRYAAMLWPRPNAWPPEIDFAEDFGGARDMMTATLHHGTPSDHKMIWRDVRADFTQWHTVGVEWTPGQLVYTLDGQPWATMTTDAVPGGRMALALQMHGGACAHARGECPIAGTPASSELQVDWVAVYEPA